jgi:hypothetical protein
MNTKIKNLFFVYFLVLIPVKKFPDQWDHRTIHKKTNFDRTNHSFFFMAFTAFESSVGAIFIAYSIITHLFLNGRISGMSGTLASFLKKS